MNLSTTPLLLRVQGLSVLKAGCWVWSGVIKDAAPMVYSNAHKGMVPVRKAMALEQGPLPDGARHKPTCGNPLCVNPAHVKRLPMGKRTHQGQPS